MVQNDFQNITQGSSRGTWDSIQPFPLFIYPVDIAVTPSRSLTCRLPQSPDTSTSNGEIEIEATEASAVTTRLGSLD